ncbi:MAG: mannose-1-phosphate guanylyltransferase [Saprospiraceae bacterium]|uniref:mannose-1-phosphate guanylyltransferase n=1 Tax=Candidatus Opimibacter skivensis TaxID=2982028 RepID=A0A9D7XNK7_9BACT|nr:mannose-1-phosphate guanylyltransferase [Candidatus Opimibacter skivensis]
MKTSPYVLIMAGGVGSRFWPASREHLPKQFLDITGEGKTLIQMTFDRFAAFIPTDNIYVITHEQYRTLTIESLPDIHQNNIITEPSRNNTAASIALASFKLSKKNPDAICIVAPADHIIMDPSGFEKYIETACKHAELYHSFVTLGIKPTRPDTGYGYIEFDTEDPSAVRKVKSFREKPNATDALFYMETGNFVWNSGIFIWRLDAILNSYKIHAPGIYTILYPGHAKYNTEKEIDFILSEYPKTEKISVDYAILEKADNVYTIPCDIGWSDVGTWNSLFEISEKDKDGNAIMGKPVYVEATYQSLIIAKHSKLVVIKGLEDFIVVDTDDCLMIFPKSEEQSIKELKEKLMKEGLGRYL